MRRKHFRVCINIRIKIATTLAMHGAMVGLAMVKSPLAHNLGCGLTFAAPLSGAMGLLTARHFINRRRRTLGLPSL